jgi:hypothetical protein
MSLNPAGATYVPPTPTPDQGYWKDILGEGSDEKIGKLFGLEGITALSTAASMFPGGEGKPEEEEYGPRGEWRPGQGYVPFQQAGVRSFSPAAASPSGMEQSWINYSPSADPSTYRRFADGGPVYTDNYGTAIQGIRSRSGARRMTDNQGSEMTPIGRALTGPPGSWV